VSVSDEVDYASSFVVVEQTRTLSRTAVPKAIRSAQREGSPMTDTPTHHPRHRRHFARRRRPRRLAIR
jgi:hypothetical protein